MDRPITLVIGTRPDALKLIPLYKVLSRSGYPVRLCATRQHDDLLDQVCDLFQVSPDIDLGIMRPNQDLIYISATILQKVSDALKMMQPSCVVVQGDTSTAFFTALAAFYLHIPVAHVEAGLRTGNIDSPFPEEINRTFITTLSTLHFAPTPINVSLIFCVRASPMIAYFVSGIPLLIHSDGCLKK